MVLQISKCNPKNIESQLQIVHINHLPVLLEEPERTQIGRRLQDDRLVRVLVADGEEKQLDHGAQITQTRLIRAVLVSRTRFAEQSEI